MKKMKVSVVIPVYNGEEFLEKNLIKLTAQTLEDIEFICVNDRSTDNSLNILTAFAMAFPDKFVVLDSKRNRGAGGARNLGLKYAKGEYIAFLDCDDTVKNDTYERVYKEASDGEYDIVVFGYADGMTKTAVYPLKIKGKATDDVKIKLCGGSLFTVDKLYKRELLEGMSMPFRENITYEDTDYCIEAIMRAKRVSYVYDWFYYYTYRVGSSSRFAENKFEKNIRVSRECFKAIRKRLENIGRLDIIKEVTYMPFLYISDSILQTLFAKPNFSYEDYLLYDEIASILRPDYYTVKFKEDGDVRNEIYNLLEEDKAKSFSKLLAKKKEIILKENSKNCV